MTGLGQEVIVNGITLNAPNGFIRSDAMGETILWIKPNKNDVGSDMISITYIKGHANSLDTESYCNKQTRGVKFIKNENFNIDGRDISICFKKGDNDFLIGQFLFKKRGYIYIINCMSYSGPTKSYFSDFSGDPNKTIMYMVAYMAGRFMLY